MTTYSHGATNAADLPDGIDDWTYADWECYLELTGLADIAGSLDAVPIQGGVSANVMRVGHLVFKQPREQLAVPGRWRANRSRLLIETRAMALVEGIAPAVRFMDASRLIAATDFIEGDSWKTQIFAGEATPSQGAKLGKILTMIHATPLVEDFSDGHVWELRYKPFLVALIEYHPDLSSELMDLLYQFTSTTTSLVHGDFSPKNILVSRLHDLLVVDWEVAHLGHPAFDQAFMLSHLFAKAVVVKKHSESIFAIATAFARAAGPMNEDLVTRALGAFLLARVHGASRLGYVRGADSDTVVRLGRAFIRRQLKSPWSAPAFGDVLHQIRGLSHEPI